MSLISQNKWRSHLHFEIASYNMKVNSHFLSFFRVHLIRKLALNVFSSLFKADPVYEGSFKVILILQVSSHDFEPTFFINVWTEEYCQTSLSKNKTSKLWHVTSILVCCIFAGTVRNWVTFCAYYQYICSARLSGKPGTPIPPLKQTNIFAVHLLASDGKRNCISFPQLRWMSLLYFKRAFCMVLWIYTMGMGISWRSFLFFLIVCD